MLGLVVEAHELLGTKWDGRIGLARVIAELDFPNARRQCFHHRPHLPTPQTLRGHVLEQEVRRGNASETRIIQALLTFARRAPRTNSQSIV